MKKSCAIALGFFLFLAPSSLRGELYQWVDSRGVIHFADNYQAVPDAFRDSPYLIVRHDFNAGGFSSEVSSPSVTQELPPEPMSSPEPEPVQLYQPIIYYNPQYFNIAVVNTIVRPPRKKPCLIPEGCRPAFRPNFDDRRYIHPSVFDGGSRQYLHPGFSQSKRR